MDTPATCTIEPLRVITPAQARELRAHHGTPFYAYGEKELRDNALKALAFPHAFGLTVRYAMKAASNATILRIFTDLGLHIDASSGHEVRRAMRAGVPASHISLSSQELPGDFAELVTAGVHLNACSLNQLRRFAEDFPGGEIGLRINPGLGSGGSKRTNVGGPASSFGIWHEHLAEAEAIVAQHRLRVVRIHTHIGSGSDPVVWQKVAGMSLDLVRRFPHAITLNLGGGYKVARMSDEKGTDLQTVGAPVKALFERFAAETGRHIHLEIEPGTFLLANAAVVVTTVQDTCDTGAEGYQFLKTDSGMTEVLRPSLYGARHPLCIVPATDRPDAGSAPYVVVGHCCESGDILTPAAGQPEELAPRLLRRAQTGDILVVCGAGAYCSSMSTKNYNSYPEAPEFLLRRDGTAVLIRRRQTPEQITQNEVPVIL